MGWLIGDNPGLGARAPQFLCSHMAWTLSDLCPASALPSVGPSAQGNSSIRPFGGGSAGFCALPWGLGPGYWPQNSCSGHEASVREAWVLDDVFCLNSCAPTARVWLENWAEVGLINVGRFLKAPPVSRSWTAERTCAPPADSRTVCSEFVLFPCLCHVTLTSCELHNLVTFLVYWIAFSSNTYARFVIIGSVIVIYNIVTL